MRLNRNGQFKWFLGLLVCKLLNYLVLTQKQHSSKTMYKRILDHLNAAILLFDRELTLTYINTAGEILLADSSRHLVGLSAHELFKSSDPALLMNLQQCLTMEEPLVDRELILDRMTLSVTINFSATPLLKNEQVNEVLVELQHQTGVALRGPNSSEDLFRPVRRGHIPRLWLAPGSQREVCPAGRVCR